MGGWVTPLGKGKGRGWHQMGGEEGVRWGGAGDTFGEREGMRRGREGGRGI